MSKAKQLRQAKILAEINESPSLRIAELAKRHKVSTETIRRDLDELTNSGHLNRTYGGAVRAESSEPSVTERHRLFVAERERIAKETMSHIKTGRIFMIGSGATTLHVARRMAIDMKNITVITHSFGVATVLSINPSIRVIVIPGEYEPTEGSVIGALAVSFLNQYFVDYAILGASGISAEGPSDALIDFGAVYSAMANRASETLIVADHSKFGMTYPARYTSWRQVNKLITDQQPLDSLRDALQKSHVDVYITT
ncbi:DeoR family transcriptional regulator [Brenneria goodwinii]|uniref:Transcriptional regulator n=1 Tax=Brenneria goodwinii TaxID=1109412 RepID=A0A0G4JRH3_9GAMM|nr:DeoR/GlpR family DNA-binding transcription regulator [Brenneria goodwinii]ATA25259.1 DeoR family transcriptional regulator [Brenneria goodwinii]RLM16878.1 DeoR family transcriptional regulator [Brenneria goodwinii]CPR14306.1 Transcriptional regulator [Brenneria goodwinii]